MDDEEFPWQVIPDHLLEICREEKQLEPRDLRAVIQQIALYLTYTLKDTQKITCARYVAHMANKYPKAFADRLDGVIIKNSYEILQTKLYSKIKNDKYTSAVVKGTEASTKKNNSNDDNNNYENNSVDDTDVKTKLLRYSQTDAIEREDVIDCIVGHVDFIHKDFFERDLDYADILDEWPILKREEFFFPYVSAVLKKNLLNSWEEKIVFYRQIIEYYEKFSKLPEDSRRSSMRTKRKTPQVVKAEKKLSKMREIISRLEGENTNSKVIGAIELIALGLDEKFHDFLIIFDVSMENDKKFQDIFVMTLYL